MYYSHYYFFCPSPTDISAPTVSPIPYPTATTSQFLTATTSSTATVAPSPAASPNHFPTAPTAPFPTSTAILPPTTSPTPSLTTSPTPSPYACYSYCCPQWLTNHPAMQAHRWLPGHTASHRRQPSSKVARKKYQNVKWILKSNIKYLHAIEGNL